MFRMRVAYHTITWGSGCLLEALGDLSALGYRAFESVDAVDQEYAGRVEEFVALIQPSGLRLSAVWGPGQLIYPELHAQEIQQNRSTLKFLHAQGATVMNTGGVRRPDGSNAPEDYVAQARILNAVGQEAWEEYGIKVCLHPHWKTSVETREELDRMANLLDPRFTWFCMDPAHLVKGGADPLDVFRTYAGRIGNVHWKDILLTVEQAHGLPRQVIDRDRSIAGFVELGQGTIDFPALLQVLRQQSYDGWGCVELDYPTARTPRESAALNRRYLEQTLGLSLELD
jgi:inosose dehydratase